MSKYVISALEIFSPASTQPLPVIQTLSKQKRRALMRPTE
jgi:hypothetical protein